VAASAVEIRSLLARAFAHDPLMVWFFPDEGSRPHACAALFGLFAEHYLAVGRVDALRQERLGAVAMWRWPDGQVEQPETLPTTSGLMTALMGPARAAELGPAFAAIAELRPAQPHAYLHLLGVEPELRGHGLGGEVLAPGLAAAREAGLVACLETMNPANLPFYRSHGFVVRHEIQLAAGGPTVWHLRTAPS
jgi:GNAT superfamily N-acetyltransferase